ncbi:MAG TPA: FtsX-like permease family protein [Methylomirabilota bacterium]
MGNVVKIAVRNLLRYTRRSLLTVSLIAFGVVFVLVFVAMTGSFKEAIVASITDSYLGHLQVHRRGYVASIETLPLNLNVEPAQLAKIQEALHSMPDVAGASERIKFNAMFSNFTETTGLRVTAVYPDREFAVCPKLPTRVLQGDRTAAALARGKILVPDLLARGMGIKVGDTVVVVATNKDGSVNGKTLLVSGILESATGPGGRDGYIHFEDAMEILRIQGKEATEVAIGLRDFGQIERVAVALRERLEGGSAGRAPFEVHTWAQLSPFASIATLIDMMALFMKLMLIAIVLISVLNVMIMAVYERVREIGTIAAIGTLPGRILSLFLVEGVLLGVAGAAAGVLAGAGIIVALNVWKVSVTFGGARQLFVLSPRIDPVEVGLASLMVIVVSVLASVQPAIRASRMEPIDALRHV